MLEKETQTVITGKTTTKSKAGKDCEVLVVVNNLGEFYVFEGKITPSPELRKKYPQIENAFGIPLLWKRSISGKAFLVTP